MSIYNKLFKEVHELGDSKYLAEVLKVRGYCDGDYPPEYNEKSVAGLGSELKELKSYLKECEHDLDMEYSKNCADDVFAQQMDIQKLEGYIELRQRLGMYD